MWERSASVSPGNRGMDPPAKTIRPISTRVPGLMGACGRRPPLAGGERAETYMVRSPCEGRATGCEGARAFAGPQQESKCTNSASLRQNRGLQAWNGTKKVVEKIIATWSEVHSWRDGAGGAVPMLVEGGGGTPTETQGPLERVWDCTRARCFDGTVAAVVVASRGQRQFVDGTSRVEPGRAQRSRRGIQRAARHGRRRHRR